MKMLLLSLSLSFSVSLARARSTTSLIYANEIHSAAQSPRGLNASAAADKHVLGDTCIANYNAGRSET